MEISEKFGKSANDGRFVLNPGEVGKLEEGINNILELAAFPTSNQEAVTTHLPKMGPSDQEHPKSPEPG